MPTATRSAPPPSRAIRPRSASRSSSTPIAPACFRWCADVAGWTFPDNDLLRLLDAQGKALVEFSEVEDGIYEAPTPGVGVLFLQNAARRRPAAEAGRSRWPATGRSSAGPASCCARSRWPPRRLRDDLALDGEARLRPDDCAARFHAVAHRPRRAGAGAGARQSLALRGSRHHHLAPPAGKRRSDHAGEAVEFCHSGTAQSAGPGIRDANSVVVSGFRVAASFHAARARNDSFKSTSAP